MEPPPQTIRVVFVRSLPDRYAKFQASQTYRLVAFMKNFAPVTFPKKKSATQLQLLFRRMHAVINCSSFH